MKLHAIYQIRDANEKLLDIPRLYAFTVKDNLLKKFSDVRKTTIFRVFTKEISEKELAEFRKKYRGRELANRKVYTRTEDNVHKQVMRIVATSDEVERAVLCSDQIIQEGARYTRVDISILKDEYIQALKTLGFLEFMKFSVADGMYPGSVVERNYDYKIEDYRQDNRVFKVDLDEFALILYFFGYTFR